MGERSRLCRELCLNVLGYQREPGNALPSATGRTSHGPLAALIARTCQIAEAAPMEIGIVLGRSRCVGQARRAQDIIPPDLTFASRQP